MDVIMRYLVTIFWDPNWPLEKKIVVVTAGVAVLLILLQRKSDSKEQKKIPFRDMSLLM